MRDTVAADARGTEKTAKKIIQYSNLHEVKKHA
jgi:hypothetical protein